MVDLEAQEGDGMKARIPKSYANLPEREKQVINNIVMDEFNRMLDEQEVQMFTQYMKMLCIVMHDYRGHGEQRLYEIIGDFATLRRRYRNIKTAEEINSVLDKEMARIFKKNGFPQDFVEMLQRNA